MTYFHPCFQLDDLLSRYGRSQVATHVYLMLKKSPKGILLQVQRPSQVTKCKTFVSCATMHVAQTCRAWSSFQPSLHPCLQARAEAGTAATAVACSWWPWQDTSAVSCLLRASNAAWWARTEACWSQVHGEKSDRIRQRVCS